MGKEQRRQAKRKARERTVHQRLVARRVERAIKMRELREEAKTTQALNKVIRERVTAEQWLKTVEDKLPEDIRDRMRANIETLRALEREYVEDRKRAIEARDRSMAEAQEKNPDEPLKSVEPGDDNGYNQDVARR